LQFIAMLGTALILDTFLCGYSRRSYSNIFILSSLLLNIILND
jgi:hypothetical protein